MSRLFRPIGRLIDEPASRLLRPWGGVIGWSFNAVANPALPPMVALTRASVGGVWDTTGKYGYVASDVPRFDVDPATLSPRGLLVEGSRTNIRPYSDTIGSDAPGGVVWGSARGTIELNTADTLAPNGLNEATKFTQAVSTSAGNVGSGSGGAGTTVSQVYSVSAFSKAGTCAFVSNNGPGGKNWFGLTVGDIGTITNGSSRISGVGNGWYRHTAMQTSVSNFCGLYTANSLTGAVVPIGQYQYHWGMQIENAAFPSSHIEAVAASTTRSSDVALVNDLSTIGGFSGTGLAFISIEYQGFTNSNSAAFSFSDGTQNNTLVVRVSAGGALVATVSVGGAVQATLTLVASPVVGTIYNIAFAFKANDFRACVNGGSVVTAASGSVPSVDRLYLGALGTGTGQAFAWIREFMYANGADPSAEELKGLTS